MISHCNGSHSKTSLSISFSLAVFCHFNPSYVTASTCARNCRLKQLSDLQDLTVRGRLFHIKAPQKAITVLTVSVLGIGKLSS